MNIFALDDDPVDAAEALNDNHANKMTTEMGQLLSTHVRILFPEEVVGDAWCGLPVWRATHPHHPCRAWLGLSPGNVAWAVDHFRAQLAQWLAWKGRTHGASVIRPAADLLVSRLGRAPRTPFALGMDSPVKGAGLDPVSVYRLYYASAKRHLGVWRRSAEPAWWRSACAEVDRMGIPVPGSR